MELLNIIYRHGILVQKSSQTNFENKIKLHKHKAYNTAQREQASKDSHA